MSVCGMRFHSDIGLNFELSVNIVVEKLFTCSSLLVLHSFILQVIFVLCWFASCSLQ